MKSASFWSSVSGPVLGETFPILTGPEGERQAVWETVPMHPGVIKAAAQKVSEYHSK